jgi:hypothetical protein
MCKLFSGQDTVSMISSSLAAFRYLQNFSGQSLPSLKKASVDKARYETGGADSKK